jgi:hypothetical protein
MEDKAFLVGLMDEVGAMLMRMELPPPGFGNR